MTKVLKWPQLSKGSKCSNLPVLATSQTVAKVLNVLKGNKMFKVGKLSQLDEAHKVDKIKQGLVFKAAKVDQSD